MFRKYPDVLTVAQVAEALGVCTKAVYSLIHANLLAHIRIGRTIKVPKYALVEYLGPARNNVKL